MTTSLSSPADLINDSLRRIGYKLRVANLYDGSEAGSTALDIYGQTRDTLLRDGEWHFAQREVNGTLLKSAPADYFPPNAWDPATMPPMPWRFSYTYPADCLKVRSVRPQPLFAIDMTPKPTLWADVNDSGGATPVRVIVANVESPVIVYTGRVTNPVSWPVDFTEALCAALARRLAPQLANIQAVPLEAQDEAGATRAAAMEQG